MKFTPHVAHNRSGRSSAVPDEIAASEGCCISQRKRKLIEQGFAWGKFIDPIRQVMVRCVKKVDLIFTMAMAACNLVRMRTFRQLHLELTLEGASLKMHPNHVPNGPEMCLKWGDLAPQSLRIVKNDPLRQQPQRA